MTARDDERMGFMKYQYQVDADGRMAATEYDVGDVVTVPIRNADGSEQTRQATVVSDDDGALFFEIVGPPSDLTPDKIARLRANR